ncbi:TPA: carbonic anhydrase [Morganella morganii]
MKRKILSTSLLIMSISCIAAENHAHWSYQGHDNPDNWGKLSPEFLLCETGKAQSPVNIEGPLKKVSGKPEFSFIPGKQELMNNGHTIQINTESGNLLKLGSDVYTLQQFHFHAPAENTINGKQFPLEAHFVYQDKDGALAVLGLMFEEGKSNPQLAHAWQHMPSAAGETAVLNTPVNIKKLLPGKQDVYRFSGSLTTPPCSEDVQWLVLKKPVSASAEQISQFRTVLGQDNNRPLQPLNGRIIHH